MKKYPIKHDPSLLHEMKELDRVMDRALKREKLKHKWFLIRRFFGYEPKPLPRPDFYDDLMS